MSPPDVNQHDPSLAYILNDESHFRSVRMSDSQVDRAANMLLSERKAHIMQLWWYAIWLVLAFILFVLVYRIAHLFYVMYWSCPIGVQWQSSPYV